ncbi:microtubule-associated protein futsch-like isoform X1 [Ptychodera flava]|uniref:microtubule-associated protein futsch-like isoform X1 n=1 Tax=Ptychodera flava TaxID=63121 RepID=UPI00396A3C52
MMAETDKNDNVCGRKFESKMDGTTPAMKGNMRQTRSGTEIQQGRDALLVMTNKMRKIRSCPGEMADPDAVSIETDEDSDSEGGISITVASESELSTSLGKDDTSRDFTMASGTSSEQIDIDDDWEAITHIWQDIENDKKRYEAATLRHTLKHSVSAPQQVQHRLPRPERFLSLPGTSGVEQLERLVKLMEELSELKKQNLELKKHSDYLEAMKNLQEMKNECLAMHCNCSAAQKFLKPGSLSFDADLVFEENSLESESMTTGVDDNDAVEEKHQHVSRQERKSRRAFNKNFEAQRKRSRSVEIGPGAADALVKEMHKRSMSRWEKVKEKFSGSKHVSVKRKKTQMTTRKSEPTMQNANSMDEQEVVTRTEDVTETKSVDSGAYFENEETHRRRKRFISSSRQSDMSENEETFYEAKNSNWLEVESFIAKSRKDSDLSTSSSDLDQTFVDDSRAARGEINTEASLTTNRRRRRSSPGTSDQKQDPQLNRSSSLQERGLPEEMYMAHGHDGHEAKGKSLTLGKMKDIILRKESGKRKNKKLFFEQEYNHEQYKDASYPGNDDAKRQDEGVVTTPTSASFSPTSSFKRKHKKHTADDLPVQEERELPFLSPKATRKSFRTKDLASAAHKKVKGWDKVKQALVKKDGSSHGDKSKAKAMDDSILAALKGENVDVTTLLGGVSEEFTRKMEEWETRKQKKSSGSSPGSKRKARVGSNSPTSANEGAPFSAGITIDWSSPVLSQEDYEAVQANLSDKFRKKLAEWEKKQSKLSAPCPSPLERLKSVSNETTSPMEMSPQMYTMEELQKNVSDKFSKKLEEWEKKKQRGLSVKEKREKQKNDKDSEEKRTKSESVEKSMTSSSRIEIYSTENVTVFKTKEGKLEYEGVSEEFEKKLAQWEKKKHLNVPPPGDMEAKAHRVDTGGDSNETAPSHVPLPRKFSDGAISTGSNRLDLSPRSRARSVTGSLDSDDTDVSSVFQYSPVTPVIIEPEDTEEILAGLDSPENRFENMMDRLTSGNRPSHSTPLSSNEVEKIVTVVQEDLPHEVLQERNVVEEVEPKSLRDESVFVDILSEGQYRALEERNKQLSINLKQRNSNLDQLKSELEKCQQELNMMNLQHHKQLDNYRKVITSGDFTNNTPPQPQTLDTSLQYLQEQIEQLESYGQRTRQDKSTLETSVMDQRLKYEKTIAKLQAEVTNLRHINLQLVSEYSKQDRVLQGDEVALLLKNAEEMQKAQDTMAVLQTKVRNFQLALLHKDKFISDMEWNLLDREAYIAMLQSEVDKQAAELSYFKTMRDSGVLRRVKSFGSREKTYLNSHQSSSPTKSTPSKFTTKKTKSTDDADLKEIFELTNSLEGRISTCEKSSFTAIPSVGFTQESKMQSTDSVEGILEISPTTEPVLTELHPVTMSKSPSSEPTAREKRKKWMESRDPMTGSPVLRRKAATEATDEVKLETKISNDSKQTHSEGKKLPSVGWSTVDISIEPQVEDSNSKKDDVSNDEVVKSGIDEDIEKLEPLVISEPTDAEDDEHAKVIMEKKTVKISSPEIQRMPKPLKVYEFKKAPSLLCCGSTHKHSITSTSSSDDDQKPWPVSSRPHTKCIETEDTPASEHHQIGLSESPGKSADDITMATVSVKSSISSEHVKSTTSTERSCNTTVSMDDQLSVTEKGDTLHREEPKHTKSAPDISGKSSKEYPSLYSLVPTRLTKDIRATQSAEAGLDIGVSKETKALGQEPERAVSRNASQDQIQRRIDSIISRTAIQRIGVNSQDKHENKTGQVRSRSVVREDRSRAERKVTPPREKSDDVSSAIRTRRSMSVPGHRRSPVLSTSTPSVEQITPTLSTKKMISLSPQIERVRLAKSPVRHVHVDMSVAGRNSLRRDSDKSQDDSSVSSLESCTKTDQRENVTPTTQSKLNKSLTITMELRPRSASVGSQMNPSDTDKSGDGRISRDQFESAPSSGESTETAPQSNEVKESMGKPPQLKMKLGQLHNLGNVKDIRKKFSDMQYSSSPNVLQLSDDRSSPLRNEKQSTGSGGRVRELSQAFSGEGLVDKRGSRGNSPSSSTNNINTSVIKQVEMFQNIKAETPESKRKTMPGISILRIRQPFGQDKDSGSDSPCDSPVLGRKRLQLEGRRGSVPEEKSGSSISSSGQPEKPLSILSTRRDTDVGKGYVSQGDAGKVGQRSTSESDILEKEKPDSRSPTYRKVPSSPKLWSSRIREPLSSPRKDNSGLSGIDSTQELRNQDRYSKDRSSQPTAECLTHDDSAKESVSINRRSLGSKQTLPDRPKMSSVPKPNRDNSTSDRRFTDTTGNRTTFKLKRDFMLSSGSTIGSLSSESERSSSITVSQRALRDTRNEKTSSRANEPGDSVSIIRSPRAVESSEVKSDAKSPRTQNSPLKEDQKKGWFSKKFSKVSNDADDLHASRLHTDDSIDAI